MKFIVTLISPDGPFTEEEVEKAIAKLFNPEPGVFVRGFYEVQKFEETPVAP